jgi:hypothetical protein
VTVNFPGGAVATTVTETRLAYTNMFGEDLWLNLHPDTKIGQANFTFRDESPRYSDVRWETRQVTTTSTPWETISPVTAKFVHKMDGSACHSDVLPEVALSVVGICLDHDRLVSFNPEYDD